MTVIIDKLIEGARNGNKPRLKLTTGERVELTGHDRDGFLVSSLGGKHEGKTARMPDALLMKAWSGEYVQESREKPPINRVLFESSRDDWPEELERKKRQVMALMERVNQVPSSKVPTHPVIVVFDRPSADDPQEARAKLDGPEIHVFDRSDPLTEFLHELSHAYWMSHQMSDVERERWNVLDAVNGGNPPRLPGEYDIGEHAFAVAYIYMLKSEILDPSYEQILSTLWLEAHRLITDLFRSVEIQERTERIWGEKGPILKAIAKGVIRPEHVRAPDRLETVGESDGVEWKRDGGTLYPCRNGVVDCGLLRKARGGMLVRQGKSEVLMKANVSGTLYVDLDGVLVDFIKGTRELGYDLDIADWDDQAKLWTDISKTPGFWDGLDWTTDGKRLWSRIKKYNPVVLTSVKMSAGKGQARTGKKRWVKDNLGENVRVVIVEDGDKAVHAKPGDVLIDDDYNGKILSAWSAAGGTSVKHENTRSTLKKLDGLGLK